MKWLRIRVPEIQLYGFIQQKGFISKKRGQNVIQQVATANSNTVSTLGNTSLSPASSAAVAEVFTDVKRGVKSATLQQ